MKYLRPILCTALLLCLGLLAVACTVEPSTEGSLTDTAPESASPTLPEATAKPLPETGPETIAETAAETQTTPETEPETTLVTITTDKTTYEVSETILLTVSANPGDTVSFYPAHLDIRTQSPIYYATIGGDTAIPIDTLIAVTDLPGENRRDPDVACYYGVLPVGDYKLTVTTPDGTVAAETTVTVVFTSDTIRTGAELAAKCLDVALHYKTLYVNGCFGAPMTAQNKTRYTQNTAYNRQPERQALINAASEDTFGFDCVCFIKGLLWGWDGDLDHVYGGAAYQSNGVPDITENAMLESCSDISRDWKQIEVGEVVWLDGHIGVYIGNGLAVECTPAWEDCVQITAANNSRRGFNTRTWSRHGKLPYLSYTGEYESVRD